MKRASQDVAGGPKVHDARLDVAGRPKSGRATDAASVCHALYDPMSTAAEDAMLIEEFADFLTGDEDFESGRLPAPDPIFRERLRRRLWRNHVVSYLRNGGQETH